MFTDTQNITSTEEVVPTTTDQSAQDQSIFEKHNVPIITLTFAIVFVGFVLLVYCFKNRLRQLSLRW